MSALRKIILIVFVGMMLVSCASTPTYTHNPKLDWCLETLSEYGSKCYDAAGEFSSCNELRGGLMNYMYSKGIDDPGFWSEMCGKVCEMRRNGMKKWQAVDVMEKACRETFR